MYGTMIPGITKHLFPVPKFGQNEGDAAAAQARFNAEQSRKQVDIIREKAGQQNQQFTEQAENALGMGVLSLARGGSLGWGEKDLPDSGVDVGSETIDKPEIPNRTELFEEKGPVATFKETKEAKGDVENWEKTRLDDLSEVETPGAASLARGSDAAVLSTAHDKFERTRRNYMRDAQNAMVTALENAENQEYQADIYEEAADWQRVGTVFDVATTAIGTVAGFSFGGPAGAALGGSLGGLTDWDKINYGGY